MDLKYGGHQLKKIYGDRCDGSYSMDTAVTIPKK